MRALFMAILLVILSSGPVWAQISVSPVIFQTAQVKAGDRFEVVCQQRGDQMLNISLSLALFERDPTEGVYFLEDGESLQKARSLLAIEEERLLLPAQGQVPIGVKVLRDDFHSAQVTLFIQVEQVGIKTRFAVLFLLASEEQDELPKGVSDGQNR